MKCYYDDPPSFPLFFVMLCKLFHTEFTNNNGLKFYIYRLCGEVCSLTLSKKLHHSGSCLNLLHT